jgi:hypothetical protein
VKMVENLVIYGILLTLPSISALGYPGGWTNVDVKRDDVQRVAVFAFRKVESQSNSAYALSLHEVLTAETQVSNVRPNTVGSKTLQQFLWFENFCYK